jgi:DNA-directed RNA polymerase specialized sigma24 family protein
LRCSPGSERPVPVDAILEALRDLDKVTADTNGAAWLRRQMRRRSIERFRTRWPRAGDDSGNALSH